jgi:hypothetical protein
LTVPRYAVHGTIDCVKPTASPSQIESLEVPRIVCTPGTRGGNPRIVTTSQEVGLLEAEDEQQAAYGAEMTNRVEYHEEAFREG